MRTFQPANPAQMEQRISEANDLFDALVDALKDTNIRRYAAEAALSLKKNSRMAHWMDAGKTATYARAQAEVESLGELEALHTVKAEYHHLEDLSKALQARIFSMLNINKAVTAAYNSYRGP